MKHKLMIALITIIVTIGAIVYVLLKTPLYEATALIEMGEYRLYNSNSIVEKVFVDNSSLLSRELNVLYIQMVENIKDRKSEITSITVPKKQNHFIEIKSLAVSNTLAKEEIAKVLFYIQKKHQNILDDVKERQELKIKNINLQIKNIETKQIKLLDKKIIYAKANLSQLEDTLKQIRKNNYHQGDKVEAITLLTLIEKYNIETHISNQRDKVFNMGERRNKLETVDLTKLIEEKVLLESMLLPHSNKNTHIIGEIIINDNPVKPKKKLIVVVASITGFLLSIFIVFFLEFIQGTKRRDSLS